MDSAVEKVTLQQVLEEKGWITYKTRGVSMEPMLRQNRDFVTVRRRAEGERFHEDDIVLYRRVSDPDRLILHRIIEVLPEGHYVILGDNCWNKENDITDADILGVLVSFVRKGKDISLDDPRYLAYVRWLRRTRVRRINSLRLCFRFRQIVKRILLGR